MTAPSSDRRANICAAVNRVDVIQISPDLARCLVQWLGSYAKLAQSRNGCLPDGLEDAAYALAESCAGTGDLRQREDSALGDAEILGLGDGAVIDANTAAEMLGISTSGVTYLCRNGRLDAQKRAGRWFPTLAAVQERTMNRSA